MYDAKLNATDVARTFRVLRRLEPDSVKELRTELRSDLSPMAKALAAKYPANPSLSGFMQTYGRWGWGKVTGTVRVTPGKSRKGAGKNNVVSLSMNYKTATPYVLEMIGWKSQGRTPQGRALYDQVQRLFPGWPNGGRLFYRDFQADWRTAYDKAETIINRWSEKVSKELNSGD